MDVGFKQNINPLRLGMKVTGAVVGLWVTAQIIDILKNTINMNDTASPFYQAYKFLGLTSGSSAGILTIAGIFVALSILTDIIDVRF